MKSYIVLTFITLFILAPKIGMIDYSALFLLVAYFMTGEIFPIRFDNRLNRIIALWFLTIIIALLTKILYSDMTMFFIIKPIRQIFIIILLSKILLNKNIDYKHMEKVFVLAAFINGCIIISQYFLHIYHIDDNFMIYGFNEEINVIYRKPGTFSGYPVAGMVSLFGLIVLLELNTFSKNIFRTILIIVMIASVILTSRMVLIFLFMYMIYYFISKSPKKSIMILLTISLSILIFQIYEIEDILPKDTYRVMFEPFINYSNSLGFSTDSGSNLLDSYKEWPQKYSTILIGNGRYIKSDNNMTVDSGPQVLFFGGGLFYLLFVHVIYILYFKLGVSAASTKEKITLVILFLFLFVSSLKGNYMFSRGQSDMLTFLTLSIFYKNRSSNKHIVSPS
jgi:hypothetical protein